MAVIRECGGKMHTRERDLEKAMEDFYEAFKSYDEAGLPWRIQCLKYLLLTSMLKASDLATFVNPLEANETRAYAKNNEIAVFIELVRFYMDGNIREFEKTLRQYEKFIMDDPFIRENMQELLKTIRSNVLVAILKPYTRVHISYLAKQLFIKDDQVEDLLISMILDDRISGKVDQVSGVLILTDDKQKSSRVNVGAALQSWHGQLANIHTRVLDKL
jgi:COP9 signalosome complex subunit 2